MNKEEVKKILEVARRAGWAEEQGEFVPVGILDKLAQQICDLGKPLDRPKVCRDCSIFEKGCEGSNQEDCGRLDRPDLREKLLVEICGVANCKKCTAAKGRCHWIEGHADSILALIDKPKGKPPLLSPEKRWEYIASGI